MKDIPYYQEKIDWQNPIKNSIIPYLGGITFDYDPRSPAAKDNLKKLIRFYSKKRINPSINKLEAFIRNHDEFIFIIEGEVGIGKTWFIRYNFYKTFKYREFSDHYFGVLDVLTSEGGSLLESLYKQLCYILEDYFTKYYGNVKEALTLYGIYIYKSRGNRDIKQDNLVLGGSNIVQEYFDIDYGIKYGTFLIRTFRYLNGARLFLAIDNADRTLKDEQDKLLELVRKEFKGTKINLIITLRDTSVYLRDRFRGLHEVSHDSMKLSPLVLDDMFIKRFKYDGKMNSLTRIKIKDQNNFYTYDNIIKRLMNSDAKELFNKISGGNASFACKMMKRLLESNQLKGLYNLGKKQHTIAALMLTDETQSDESAPIINLFNNKEGHCIGNFLVRYRVLEYFYHELSCDPSDIRYKNYFKMLGYDINRVKKVLERMLMASILYSTKGLTPNQFEDTSIDKVGILKITQTGKAYFDILLKEVWYYIAAKHEMIENVRKDYLTIDEAERYVYMTHKDFSRILKNDEDNERIKIGHFNVKHGEIIEYYSLKQPSQIALNILWSKKNG